MPLQDQRLLSYLRWVSCLTDLGIKAELVYEFPVSVRFISPQQIPGAFESCGFPLQRGRPRALEQHTAPLWSSADAADLSFTPSPSIHSLTLSQPGAPLLSVRTRARGGRRSIICMVQKEEGRLTEVHRLFFPLALARHANEQRHMWLCD